jgi:transcriptional regulator with XRE-family HTH domain
MARAPRLTPAVDAAGEAFATELARLRADRGLSQGALARLMSVDRSYVSHVERCTQAPTIEFTRLADAALDANGALWARWEHYATARRRAQGRRPGAGDNVVSLHPLWSTEDVARFLAFSPRTIRRWRMSGFGPPWFQIGGRVRYDSVAVRRWLDDLIVEAEAKPPAWAHPTGPAVQLRLVPTT